ncbi:hypothetical protein PR001_g1304 [Phytophthora rubi]|nr:hypothetical protein PR002_g13699 [Phytophthora rubi]KAE9051597.1 hypothetical protein PR001_g1304 [Phytophthora rubi]
MMDSNAGKVKGTLVVVVLAADFEPCKNVPRMQQLNRDNSAPDAFTTFAAATFLYAAQAHDLATCPMDGLDLAKVKEVLDISDLYSLGAAGVVSLVVFDL